jgi:hypothetical protein
LPAVDPDASVDAVILAIFLRKQFGRLLLFTLVYLEFFSPASARGALSFLRCLPPHADFLPFPLRLFAELSCISIAVKRTIRIARWTAI